MPNAPELPRFNARKIWIGVPRRGAIVASRRLFSIRGSKFGVGYQGFGFEWNESIPVFGNTLDDSRPNVAADQNVDFITFLGSEKRFGDRRFEMDYTIVRIRHCFADRDPNGLLVVREIAYADGISDFDRLVRGGRRLKYAGGPPFVGVWRFEVEYGRRNLDRLWCYWMRSFRFIDEFRDARLEFGKRCSDDVS